MKNFLTLPLFAIFIAFSPLLSKGQNAPNKPFSEHPNAIKAMAIWIPPFGYYVWSVSLGYERMLTPKSGIEMTASYVHFTDDMGNYS